jgi:hypothetical protein
VPNQVENDEERSARIERIIRNTRRKAKERLARNKNISDLRAGARQATATLETRPRRKKHA